MFTLCILFKVASTSHDPGIPGVPDVTGVPDIIGIPDVPGIPDLPDGNSPLIYKGKEFSSYFEFKNVLDADARDNECTFIMRKKFNVSPPAPHHYHILYF